MFSVTALLANIIPNVPYQVGRQILLEKQLLKEDRYSKTNINGEAKKNMDDYDQFLLEVRQATIEDARKLCEVVNRNTWVRRISRRISAHSLATKWATSNEEVHEN